MMDHDKHLLQKPPGLSNRFTLQNHLKNFAKIGLLLGLVGVVVDSAVETYLANSPIKWAVVTGAMITMTLAFLGWVKPGWVRKRYGWNALSIILFLLITFSTAAAFWLMPYDDHIIVFTGGQTLSTLLFVLSIAAIIVATVVLWPVVSKHKVIKTGIGLIALYTLFSFVHEFIGASSYLNVFAKDAFFDAFPIWLKGATFGTFFLIPAALVCQIVMAVKRQSNTQWPRWLTNSYLLSIGLAVSLHGFFTQYTITQDQLQTFSGSPVRATQSESNENIVAVTSEQESEPTDNSQPTLAKAVDKQIKAIALTFKGDPAQALAWVSSNIRLEAYSGVLKGYRGAFLTRAGNSTDRALLLQRLILASDPRFKTRFAWCKLDNSNAEDQMRAALAPVPSRPLLIEAAAEAAKQANDPEIKQALEILDQGWAHLRNLSKAEANALSKTLDHLKLQLEPTPYFHSTVRESLRQHIWLQVEQFGSWNDFDPAAFASGRAKRICEVSGDGEKLSDGIYHRVKIRLMVEKLVNGSFVAESALTASFTTAELVASRVAFAFRETVPLENDQDIHAARSGTEATYTPVLRLDNRTIAGTSFMLPSPSKEGMSGAIEGMSRSLFDAIAPSTPSPAPASSPITAAWLDFTLITPQSTEHNQRSTIFDRVPFAMRKNNAIDPSMFKQFEQIPGEYVDLAAIWQIGFLLGETQFDDVSWTGLLDVSTFDGLSGQLDLLLRTYEPSRRALAVTDESPFDGVFRERPGLALIGIVPHASQNGLTYQIITDVVVPLPPLRVADERDVTLAARDGTAALTAEHVITDIAFGKASDTSGPLTDVLSVFIAARENGVQPVLLEPGDHVAVAGAAPDALARIQSRLDQGFSAIVPASAQSQDGSDPRLGWWLYESQSNVLWDEFQNGRHETSPGYIAKTGRVLGTIKRFYDFACRIKPALQVTATALVVGFTFTGNPNFANTDYLEVVVEIRKKEEESEKLAEELGIACGGGVSSGKP